MQVAGHINKAFQTAGINPEQEMNQIDFVEAFKKVIISVAQSMRQQPLTVAHTEKVFDGSSITSLLKDRQSLDLVCQNLCSDDIFHSSCHILHAVKLQ